MPCWTGYALAQAPLDLLDGRQLAGLRVRPLRRPPLELALDVAVVAGEVAEADGVDVDGVQSRRARRSGGSRRRAGVARSAPRPCPASRARPRRRSPSRRRARRSPPRRCTGRAPAAPARRSVPTAEMMRCSRAMSWAVASTWPSGGRRSTSSTPLASVTLNVRFEWPPAISSNVNGADAPVDVLGEPGADLAPRRSHAWWRRPLTAATAPRTGRQVRIARPWPTVTRTSPRRPTSCSAWSAARSRSRPTR